MTADAESYVAWDGRRYNGLPPSGWYQGADNRWWPSSDSPSDGTEYSTEAPPSNDPPPPVATDAVVPTLPPQPVSNLRPPPPRPAPVHNDVPAPTAWAPAPGGQPPPPSGPPMGIGVAHPPPKRRLHPALLVVGGVAALFYFRGFLENDGYEVSFGAPTATTTFFEETTSIMPEGDVEDFTSPDETASTGDQSNANGIEPPPTSVVEFFDTSSDLSFRFSGCTNGVLNGTVTSYNSDTFSTVSFTVVLDAASSQGRTTELYHTFGPLDPFETDPFSLRLPDDLLDVPDCQYTIIEVFTNE